MVVERSVGLLLAVEDTEAAIKPLRFQ